MKILINNQTFQELPIDLNLLIKHVMRDGLRTKFAILIHASLMRTEREIIEERAAEAGEDLVSNTSTTSSSDNIKLINSQSSNVFDDAESEKKS